MITPEYLPPEILEFVASKKEDPEVTAEKVIQNSHSWSLDVWSLGTILFEIISGFPIWMYQKCKVTLINKRVKIGKGLFGTNKRDLV